jgi:hypothetical protein
MILISSAGFVRSHLSRPCESRSMGIIMKSSAAAPLENGVGSHHDCRTGDISSTSGLRRRLFRLSPITAIGIAAAGLVLGVGLETGQFGFRLAEAPTLGPAEAVDISLRCLMRARVKGRLERQGRLNDSPARNRAETDNEMARVREHPLYVVIKEMMTDHLRITGYDRVRITPMPDPEKPMLSLDAQAELHRFLRSLRASFPATNEDLVIFLKDQERNFGESAAVHCGAGRYDAEFCFLIQVLAGFPDELEPVASAVRFRLVPVEEIERRRQGNAQVVR